MKKSHPKPTKIRFLKAYFVTAQILFRYFNLFWITKILGKTRTEHQKQSIHLKTAKQIKSNILELKGLFIKVGQMLSIMTHFLPKAITEELEGLQDAVPPATYEEIELRFVEEFQQKPTEYFAKFEKEPIASASLGQVHAAWSQAGQKFAVKVQYPDIEEIVRMDLKTLKRIFGLFHLIFPQYGLKKTYREIREVILEELDFKNEGKNLELLKKNLSKTTDLIFPKVYWEHSTSRVLTLEFMEGVKISNHQGLQALAVTPSEVAKRIIHAYCRQIFVDGIYHADPHPGNFLVKAVEEEVEVFVEGDEEDEVKGEVVWQKRVVPKIVMMDFGAVARISEPMRKGIARFVEGIIKRDNHVISQAMKEMGFISKTENEEIFDKIVEFFYSRLKDIKFEDIKTMRLEHFQRFEDVFEFRKLDISWKDLLQTFNVPKDWALLERTLLLLVGLTTHLDPNLNPLTIIIPYAQEFVLGKDRTFADLILDAAKELALGYIKLPSELERTLRRLNQGEIEIFAKNSDRQAQMIRGALHRLSYVLLILGGMGLGYLFKKEGMPQYEWFYYGSGFFGFLLGMNLLRRR